MKTGNEHARHWYVLRVQSGMEEEICRYLNRDDTVTAFCPRYEYYRRDIKGLAFKALFPGYVFVLTNKKQNAFDQWYSQLEVKKGLWFQLKYKTEQEVEVSALTDEEIYILSALLDDEYILRMSYGHLVQNKVVITEGPLVGYEPYIEKVDKHNRQVVLSLFFLNQIWKVGLTIQNQEK